MTPRLCLLAALLPALAHAAVAEVWPSRVKRLEDGKLEYSYDLRPVKARRVTVDFGPDVDDAAAAAFLRALPDQTVALVDPRPATVRLHAPEGLEDAPLAASFAGVAPTPKLLASADLLLWHHRLVQDGAWAALHLRAHEGGLGLPMDRAAFLRAVLAVSLQRAATMSGDGRDGARRLAARLGGAVEAAGAPGPRPWRSDPALAEQVQAEAQVLARPQPRFPSAPWTQWSEPLSKLAVWDRAVHTPFENTRAGAAAVLTWLDILEGDPKLRRAEEALRGLRDQFLGDGERAPLDAWREAVGEAGARAGLDDLSQVLIRLGRERSEAPFTAPLVRGPDTAFTKFLGQLDGREQLHGVEELVVAVQDGRVAATGAGSWGYTKDSWGRPLVSAGEGERLSATGDFRQRLSRTFQALLGAHGEVQGGEGWLDQELAHGADDGAPKIRLMVPPHLELEPLPRAYAEVAAGWERLGAALRANRKVGAAKGLGPGGGARTRTLAAEAARMQALFHGLSWAARVALGEEAPTADADRRALREATRYLAGWRADPDLRHDARYLLPVGEDLEPGTFVHSGVLGVGVRALEARFEQAPAVELKAKDPSAFVAEHRAVQRYQLPVLATGAVTVPRAEPLAPAQLRSLADRAGRRDAIEAALPGALVRSLRQVETPAP